jgi:hypothetical protein
MKHAPADARAAPSASGPGNMDTSVPDSPKRQREEAPVNKVSPGATSWDPAKAENQRNFPEAMWPARASTSQSPAHHATLTGRCLKAAGLEAPPTGEPQVRSTLYKTAERQTTSRKGSTDRTNSDKQPC